MIKIYYHCTLFFLALLFGAVVSIVAVALPVDKVEIITAFSRDYRMSINQKINMLFKEFNSKTSNSALTYEKDTLSSHEYSKKKSNKKTKIKTKIKTKE